MYDHIVLGATLPGVFYAAALAREGRSVLLTNQYGFPGGSITESLNCFQEAPPDDCAPLLRDLFNEIAADALAPSVINPETMKYSLQLLLESTAVDILYHVVLKKIGRDRPESVNVEFLAKEGERTFRGNHVLDATDDLAGAAVLGNTIERNEHTLNVIITPPADRSVLSFPSVIRTVRLNDGRYWLSISISPKDELFREDGTHRMIEDLRIQAERAGSRIQLLPLGIQSKASCSSGTALNGSFATVDALIGRTFDHREQYIRTSELLTTLGQSATERKEHFS